ncbi:Are2p [Sugiyamaella lignohabitans]|uniref:O-acyltransferase n=1 Tax=Sugiyamaella lignohabitans TaxID=796027 RepID=A0A167E933_9ASCO|nr:Are2p [Sugiyamaella lignohabitans]ANB13792.1 Are2p [Sugiyamaella lignohabitans]
MEQGSTSTMSSLVYLPRQKPFHRKLTPTTSPLAMSPNLHGISTGTSYGKQLGGKLADKDKLSSSHYNSNPNSSPNSNSNSYSYTDSEVLSPAQIHSQTQTQILEPPRFHTHSPHSRAHTHASGLSHKSNTGLTRKKSNSSTSGYLPHYKPIHTKSSASILSLSKHSPTSSYTGFRHLAMIVLTLGNLRLMIHDYQTYGFIMTLYRLGISQSDLNVAGLLLLSTPIHLFIALLIELGASKTVSNANHTTSEADNAHQVDSTSGITTGSRLGSKENSSVDVPTSTTKNSKASSNPTEPNKPHKKYLWKLFAALHTINATLVLIISSYTVYTSIWHPLIGTVIECHSIILCLKVSSYALTNRDLRDAYLEDAPVPELYGPSKYPHNLTIGNLVYFWWAPTLVYQPEYPRAPKVRYGFLVNRVLEMVGTIVLIWFLSGQYAVPILESSLVHFQNADLGQICETIMRLSTVSIVVWLLGFFFIFQSYLNFLAELLRFGDRDFYQDWWNAGSVGTYWRLWNKPVSNYFRRHFYAPLLKRGWTPMSSSLVVFFISAVLHELVVGIPTRNVIGVAFVCMMLQVPLIMVTAPLEKMRGPATTVGNCIFWLSFFLGQPVAVLMYYFAWNVKNGTHIKI